MQLLLQKIVFHSPFFPSIDGESELQIVASDVARR